jgi:pimeloyl-ACP methyl ester carboxylesterase
VSPSRPPPASQWVDLDGPVHFVDYGGPADGPLLVCVHGLGGSVVNWGAVAPLLTDTARVIALDLPGFGHTRAVGRSASIGASQRLLHRFLTEVVKGPALLVGNSMGGLVTLLHAQAHPTTVAGAVLVDPALPWAAGARPDPLVTAMFSLYAVPPLGRAALKARRRRGPERGAMDVLRLCCVDPARLPEDILHQHLDMARARVDYPEVGDAMLEAARSLMSVLARRRRFAAMLDDVGCPVLLLHGDRDRLVPVASARAVARAHPSWRFEVARDVGHVPQLEVPEWTAAQILDWLGTGALAASTRARHTVWPPSQPESRHRRDA